MHPGHIHSLPTFCGRQKMPGPASVVAFLGLEPLPPELGLNYYWFKMESGWTVGGILGLC